MMMTQTPRTATGQTRQLATELRDFLLTATAHKLHHEAGQMALALTFLLNSCTSDEANELLEAEVESIVRILQ